MLWRMSCAALCMTSGLANPTRARIETPIKTAAEIAYRDAQGNT